jgi:hypothetical protein
MVLRRMRMITYYLQKQMTTYKEICISLTEQYDMKLAANKGNSFREKEWVRHKTVLDNKSIED